MSNYILSQLDELESEAIFIIREVVANFETPALLFSGGKDSILLTHIAKKAFYPARIPFPLIHIDTGHNFPETILFRDNLIKKLEVKLIEGSVQAAIDNGIVKEENGIDASRNLLQIETLLECLEFNKIDAAIGGARRDEEKSRAKERIFSHRDEFGHWQPKNQRPELWNLYNSKKNRGEHFRVFPISNWTEIDVWEYIKKEKIDLPSLYFSHKRECVVRDNIILAKSDFLPMKENEEAVTLDIRFRTCGDMPITGAIKSKATNVDQVIHEILSVRTTERGSRADDKRGRHLWKTEKN